MPVNHVAIIVEPSQFAAVKKFYLAVLGVLGYLGLKDPNGAPDFWVVPKEADDRLFTRSLHIAFTAPDQESIKLCHEVAM
jgi:hypothetical protein